MDVRRLLIRTTRLLFLHVFPAFSSIFEIFKETLALLTPTLITQETRTYMSDF